MAKPQTIEAWLREIQSDVELTEGNKIQLSLVSLFHIRGGGREEIYPIRLGLQHRQYTTEEMAKLFHSKAENSVSALMGTVQFFELQAFFGENPKEPTAKKSFSISVAHDFDGLSTEGATPQGVQQQSMRHLEAGKAQVYQVQRAQSQAWGDLVQAQQNFMAIMAGNQEKMMRENADAHKIVSEVLMKQMMDDHKLRMEQMAYERRTEMYAKAMTFVPPLVNTLTGREVFPQSTADTALLKLLEKHVSAETAMELASKLPPEVVGVVMDRLSKLHDERVKEEKDAIQRKRSLTAARDPEQDMTGQTPEEKNGAATVADSNASTSMVVGGGSVQ